MGINVEELGITLKLNRSPGIDAFTRIMYFRDAARNGARIKAKFKRVENATFRADGTDEGIEVLQNIISSGDRSGLDFVRLLNRGGKAQLDIAHIEMSATIRSVKAGQRNVFILQGDVNKVLKAGKDAITLDTCNTGLRAQLALEEADLDGIRRPYTVDPNKLLAWFDAMKREYPPTLYNNIQNAQRVGWAIISRTGEVDDIHGRRHQAYSKEAEFIVPTPIYKGYMKEILEDLKPMLGPIFRARLIGIHGPRAIAPHHDGHDGTRFYRFHIPIIPNKRCIFSSAGRDFVMDEPGRLYRFPAWETHSVVNYDGERVHLLFSAEGDSPAAQGS